MNVNYKGINTPYSNSKQAWQGFESDYPNEVGEIEFKYLSDLIQFFAAASKKNLPPNMKSDWMFPL
ncbi:hypothetical protein [Bacteroides thetaiotaomicron]|uniref:hypothetical protein n=1 Tax=Bacteroides thetaiotaomicron TaxID=818 RepID=UPI00216541D8|nr:hypothetical protein [Bacteroides thetaiotaomicron]MCS2207875.1 hypothetical protein [Bacteroides thetaiotaomicron]